MQILFVCMGNICRSPMAEGLFRHKAKEVGIEEKLTIDSAGTGGWHAGEAPDPRAQVCMRKKGIDISDQEARQFVINDFDEFDMIFVMDESNYAGVIEQIRSPEDRRKVKLFLTLDPELRKDVPDPYAGGEDGFENVFDLLDRASDILLKEVQEKLAKKS